ncbi:hypothetical protein FOYG_08103 [Fusarium oxysporum NRRL 32931]|uniref:Uncharacterized protein n=1 Tax=Fusarium oxysporum NRRL 32931 TaxID=660029 RepID=W9I7P0_FUSOX|nr:hypothetical protein FOYG_08103 [Fusarium oxysporum NRRL 32931]
MKSHTSNITKSQLISALTPHDPHMLPIVGTVFGVPLFGVVPRTVPRDNRTIGHNQDRKQGGFVSPRKSRHCLKC